MYCTMKLFLDFSHMAPTETHLLNKHPPRQYLIFGSIVQICWYTIASMAPIHMTLPAI